MAKVTHARRINKQELGKDIPPWVDRLLFQMNQFNSEVAVAFNGDIGAENLRVQVHDLSFTTLSTYSSGDFDQITFRRTIKTRPIGLVLLKIRKVVEGPREPIKNGVHLDWDEQDQNIRIYHVSGLENDSQYEMRVMIW